MAVPLSLTMVAAGLIRADDRTPVAVPTGDEDVDIDTFAG